MGYFKDLVKDRAKPEGSIITRFAVEEASNVLLFFFKLQYIIYELLVYCMECINKRIHFNLFLFVVCFEGVYCKIKHI